MRGRSVPLLGRPLSGRHAALLAGAASAVACRAVTDAPLPPGAARFAPPPVYARWWAMTEVCSGVRRPLAAVAFYRAPGPLPVTVDGQHADGYYVHDTPAGDQVVLTAGETLDGTLVRHEMLHALLRAPGHPRAAFLGRCAALVGCRDLCVRDAGPGPHPDPAAVVVPPTALRFALDVAPALRAGGVPLAPADGFLTFTVRVRNPAPYPVVVRNTGRGGWQLPGFGYIVMGPALTRSVAPPGDDSASTVFAPGETRAAVFDFAVAPAQAGLTRLPEQGYNGVALGRGHYTLSGIYGAMWSDTVGVTVGP